MATIIVYNCVWTRVKEYYENVEEKYPNTWDVNDTVEQISKIQLVINDFEHISAWCREPIIPHWKQMGWEETWWKSCPWHFAFERNCNDGDDCIVIHDAEHQDNIKESCNKTNNIITEHKIHNIMNKKNKIRLTKSQLHKIIMESVKSMLKEDVFDIPPLSKCAPHTQKMLTMFENLRQSISAIGKYANEQGIFDFATPRNGHIAAHQYNDIKKDIEMLYDIADHLQNNWGYLLYKKDKNYKSRSEFQLPR